MTALVDAAEHAIAGHRHTEAHELLTRARATRGYERALHVLSAWRSLADALPRSGVRASWQTAEFPGLSVSPCALDLSMDGARVVSGGRTLRVYDTATGHCLREWGTGTDNPVRRSHDRAAPSLLTAVRISPDQQCVLSAAQDGQICLWSIETGDCLMQITSEQTGGTQPAHFSADGRWALVADRNKAIHLWDLESARRVRTVTGHGPSGHIITDLWLSQDASCAVSSGSDRTVRVWDMDTGECIHVLHGHTDSIGSVSLSPDGAFVISSSSDQTIRLWDLASGACVHVQEALPGNAQTVRYICDGRQASALTPDGRFALTAGVGTPLRLWELDWDLST